jgi:hypothetical protein
MRRRRRSGRAEPADAGQRGELGSGEGQFLLGEVFSRLRGVAGGLGEMPSAGHAIGDAGV